MVHSYKLSRIKIAYAAHIPMASSSTPRLSKALLDSSTSLLLWADSIPMLKFNLLSKPLKPLRCSHPVSLYHISYSIISCIVIIIFIIIRPCKRVICCAAQVLVMIIIRSLKIRLQILRRDTSTSFYLEHVKRLGLCVYHIRSPLIPNARSGLVIYTSNEESSSQDIVSTPYLYLSQ